MEMRQHLHGVSHRTRQFGPHSEVESIWSFKVSEEMYQRMRDRLVAECQKLYNKYTGNGTATWSCPALGEWDDDFCWVYFGDKEIPLNLYEAGDGGILEIVLNNRPDDELDRLDPDHQNWFTPQPTQWLEALSAFRQLANHI